MFDTLKRMFYRVISDIKKVENWIRKLWKIYKNIWKTMKYKWNIIYKIGWNISDQLVRDTFFIMYFSHLWYSFTMFDTLKIMFYRVISDIKNVENWIGKLWKIYKNLWKTMKYKWNNMYIKFMKFFI